MQDGRAETLDRIDQLEKMLAAEPGDTFVLYSLGHEYAKADKHEAAVEHYQKCLEADPGEHYAYFHMARSLEAMGEQARAAEVLKAGLERARGDGNEKASGEIAQYLSQLG